MTEQRNAENDAPPLVVEYLGLTHRCTDPECHVAGFIETLRRTENQSDLTDAELAALSLARVLALAEQWGSAPGGDDDPRIKYRREAARLINIATRNPLGCPTPPAKSGGTQ